MSARALVTLNHRILSACLLQPRRIGNYVAIYDLSPRSCKSIALKFSNLYERRAMCKRQNGLCGEYTFIWLMSISQVEGK